MANFDLGGGGLWKAGPFGDEMGRLRRRFRPIFFPFLDIFWWLRWVTVDGISNSPISLLLLPDPPALPIPPAGQRRVHPPPADRRAAPLLLLDRREPWRSSAGWRRGRPTWGGRFFFLGRCAARRGGGISPRLPATRGRVSLSRRASRSSGTIASRHRGRWRPPRRSSWGSSGTCP